MAERHGAKILVVDDEAEYLQTTIQYLRESGEDFDCLSAIHGAMAIQVAKSKLPDLIITDWDMPVMNGIEATTALKQDPETRDIPVIVSSGAMTTSSHLRLALEAGAVDFIRKPIDRLELIARVRTVLELARSYKEIKRQKEIVEKRNRDFMDSVVYARRIQEAILPDKESFGRRLGGAFVYSQPRDVVSGDFFWYFDKRKEVMAACADCTGHGVPGAFMSILGNNILGAITRDFGMLKPNLLLSELNERMMATLQKTVLLENFSPEPTLDGMDIAIVHIDVGTRKVSFSGAHRPLIYFKSGEMHEIRGTNCSIGGVTAFKRLDFELHEIELSEGDSIYMYTDGITDQFCESSSRKYGQVRLKKLFSDIQGLSMEEQGIELSKALLEWRGSREMQDDQTVVGLKL